jgi:uncharacterized protein
MNETTVPSARTRMRRRPYAKYDAETVNAILDAGVLAHIGYIVDGAPYVTPTMYWREADRIYWHGAGVSRIFRDGVRPLQVCLAVSHVDGFVLARCAFRHTLHYRSVMAFGEAELVADATEKRRLLDLLIDRLYPGRSRELREISAEEFAATYVMAMTIEDATAKVSSPQTRQTPGPIELEADYAHTVWAGMIPIRTIMGQVQADQRLLVDPTPPPNIALYGEGARLDDVLRQTAALQQSIEAADA